MTPLQERRVSLYQPDIWQLFDTSRSPPRGRFSHVAMFRIGSALFVPSYLTVTLYRPFASANDDGGILLMAGKRAVLSSSSRSTHHVSISPFIQHVSLLDPYCTFVNRRHAGPVRSDTVGQHSPTPRSPCCSTTVRVFILRSVFCTHHPLTVVSPPHVVGYTNGIAQSIVSLSRFLGPIIGGTVSCSARSRET